MYILTSDVWVSPSPQQPRGEEAKDSQLSSQPVLLPPRRGWGGGGRGAVGGAVAADYVQVCVIYC